MTKRKRGQPESAARQKAAGLAAVALVQHFVIVPSPDIDAEFAAGLVAKVSTRLFTSRIGIASLEALAEAFR